MTAVQEKPATVKETRIEPFTVYKIISDGIIKYTFEIGQWYRSSGFEYENMVEAIAKNKPRPLATQQLETPKFAQGKWRFEQLSSEELGQLEQDIESYRTTTLLKQ